MLEQDLNTQTRILEHKILDSHNIVIIPHYNPDGDAIGSALSLLILLHNINKDNKVQVICPNQIPYFLKWLPWLEHIKILDKNTEKDPNLFQNADLIICVDFNSLTRINNISEQFISSQAYKILIDHHPNPSNFVDLLISNPSYSATAELLYDIYTNSSFHKYIDKDIATCLYAGIITDTGFFSYSSTSPKTFNIASELLAFGIDKDSIYDKIYNSFSYNRMRFMGHIMLNRMQIISTLKTSYIYITHEDRKKFCEQFGDTENFVNIPLSIKGIVFSAIFIERDNFIKISFRSKGHFDVNEFSKQHFNGGGHVNASGGESFTSLKDTINKFLQVLDNYSDTLINYKY